MTALDQKALAAALADFTEYFVKNYPGPNTIIGDPNWHAPKIFRAAVYAINQALAALPAPEPVAWPIKYVRQRGTDDCGVASLAMITGLPYEEVLKPFAYLVNEGHGLSEFRFYDWLIQQGWAWQVAYKVHHLGASNQKKAVWPPKPWAPVHLIQARVPSGNYHFVVMDGEGRVFDPWKPERTSLDHPDYQEILFVWGLWPTRPLNASPPSHQGLREVVFRRGDRVSKKSGSSWHGIVVGEYSTSLTPEGYCVESEREPGSVQLYPVAALQSQPAPSGETK